MFKSRAQLNPLSTLGLVLIWAGAARPVSALVYDFEIKPSLMTGKSSAKLHGE